jgi:starch phosphorylase
MAKLIIRFINGIAETINADPDMDGRLRVVFLADYNVKLGEKVYPAADLSEQISTAGKEASGTGNMKFAMNGALTIGTLDGANVEIREQVGADNFFLFGKTTEEIAALHQGGYRPWELIATLPELAEVLRMIEQGHFSNGDSELFRPLLQNLTGNDPFFVLADFADYLRAQDAVSEAWGDRRRWNRMSLLNSARTGFFSSDRAIRDYAERIWQAAPFPVTISCEID